MLRQGMCKKLSFTYVINCLTKCVSTVRQPGTVTQHYMLQSTCALTPGNLLYSTARTQVECLTVTCKYFIFLATTLSYPHYLLVLQPLATRITCVYCPDGGNPTEIVRRRRIDHMTSEEDGACSI